VGIKVLLLSGEGKAKQAYLDTIKHLDIDVDTVSSITELYKTMINKPCHGVMIDLPTKIKASRDEKALVHEVLNKFPVINLRWENETGTIKTLYHSKIQSGGTIKDFINQECRSFNPRTIRSSVRKNINFNVMLTKSDNFKEENMERTITIDVSKGGCFIYSPKKWERHSDVLLIIKELEDHTPIRGKVIWGIAWGEAMRIPGIGVMFKEIKSSQLENISDHTDL
jgi:Tfp pilus assembly protein PilZ